MKNLDYKEYYKRNLPHFQPNDISIAITLRLAFSLPAKIIEDLKLEKHAYELNITKYEGENLKLYKTQFRKKYFEIFDNFLDNYSNSPKWLIQKSIATQIKESLHYLDSKMYDLIAYCIMPNHLHLIITPLKKNNQEYFSLAKITYSFKRFTATNCNKILNRNGQFWHHESYDHVIRDSNDYNNQISYLINNPIKAKLISKDKKWNYL